MTKKKAKSKELSIDKMIELDAGGSFRTNNRILYTLDFRRDGYAVTVGMLERDLHVTFDTDRANQKLPKTLVVEGIALCIATPFDSLYILASTPANDVYGLPTVDNENTKEEQPEFEYWQQVSKNWGVTRRLYDEIENWWSEQIDADEEEVTS